MTTALYAILGIALLAAIVLAVWRAALSYARFRGKRVVPCPETKEPVGLDVDARYAAVSAIVGSPQLRVQDCTRWPERRSCGQECLARIEAAPEECLVRTILGKWYEGKSCALCGRPFGTIHWAEHLPALMNPRNETVEWRDLRAESVNEAMETHRPVCWDCHIAETFRRKYPGLVVERKRPTPPTS